MTFMRNLVTSKNKDLDTWLVTAWKFFCLFAYKAVNEIHSQLKHPKPYQAGC